MQYDTSTRLRDAAVKVASAFLARDEGLTDGVVKEAQAARLSTDQARRVCERANHLVHAALRKRAADVEFEVADPQEVDRRLGATEKIATRYFEYTGGVMEKTAAVVEDDDARTVREREEEHAAQREKTAQAALRTDLEEKRVLAGTAYEAAQEGFCAVLLKHASDGGDLAETMEEIAQYSPLATQPEVMLTAARLVKFAHVTRWGEPLSFTPRTLEILHSKEELEKVAANVDPELTNPGLQVSGTPVKFVRGRHAVWASVDTLLDAYLTALMSHDAVARGQLAPDHTRAESQRTGVVNHSDHTYSAPGRTV